MPENTFLKEFPLEINSKSKVVVLRYTETSSFIWLSASPPSGPLNVNHPIAKSEEWINQPFTHCDIAVSSHFLIFSMHISPHPPQYVQIHYYYRCQDKSHSITLEWVISHGGEVVARFNLWGPHSLRPGPFTLDFITTSLEENSPAISHPEAIGDSDHTSGSESDWAPFDWQRH